MRLCHARTGKVQTHCEGVGVFPGNGARAPGIGGRYAQFFWKRFRHSYQDEKDIQDGYRGR